MGTDTGIRVIFKDEETLMDENPGYRLIQADNSRDPQGYSYHAQLDSGLLPFSKQQDLQSLNVFAPGHVGLTAMPHVSSPMDFSTEPSSSADSGSSSKSVTPLGQLAEDSLGSRRSSYDYGNVGFMANITSNHRLPTTEAFDAPSMLLSVSGVDGLTLQQQQQLSHSMSEFAYTSSVGSATSDIGENEEDPAFKRAEQNRAAQRAFRQRKQQYIKWLEGKAEELEEVYRIMALVRTENQQLRKLVLELDASLNGPPKDTAASTSTFGRAPCPKIDLSLSREIAARLMNLSTFSGTSGDRSGAVGRPKYQPRSSIIGKTGRGKGKSVYKLNQLKEQQQQQVLMLQNQEAIQLQEQLRQREQQRQQQQQQQRDTTMSVMTDSSNGHNPVVTDGSLAPTVTSDLLSMTSASRPPLRLACSEQTFAGTGPLSPITETMATLSTRASPTGVAFSNQAQTQSLFALAQPMTSAQQRSLSTPTLFPSTSSQGPTQGTQQLVGIQGESGAISHSIHAPSFQYPPPPLHQQPQLEQLYQHQLQQLHGQQAQPLPHPPTHYPNQFGNAAAAPSVPQVSWEEIDAAGIARTRRSSMPALCFAPRTQQFCGRR
ncbi:hypothetical protein BGX34_001976 [Mortierella sp. NVP85]|nr:hypothetical protein BGX34_001976 [Mortierella sp. NVP85]